MERLKDKVAIVSGAADGMGEAIVKLYAAEGAQVLGVDLNAEKLKEAHGSGTNSIKLLEIDVRSLFSAPAVDAQEGRQGISGRCCWMNSMSIYGAAAISIRAQALLQSMSATLRT